MGGGVSKDGQVVDIKSPKSPVNRGGTFSPSKNGANKKDADESKSGSSSARNASDTEKDDEKFHVEFAQCLEVLQNCDTWSDEEREAFVQRIKDEKLDFLVDASDDFGNTLLILATMGQQVEVVELLLQHGAEPDHQNSAGFCALHYCSAKPAEPVRQEKARRIVELLLKYGGNTNLIEATAGCTPLHYAASENNKQVCDILLKNGASVSLRCKNGFLPEAYARASGHNELADYLHEKMKASVSAEVKAKIQRKEANGGHGWQKHYDAKTGKYFYYNHRTLKSTWDRPVEMDLFAGENNEGDQSLPPNEDGEELDSESKDAESKGQDPPKQYFAPHTPTDSPVSPALPPNSDEPDLEKLELKKQLEDMQKRLEEAHERVRKEEEQVKQLQEVAKESDERFEKQRMELMKDLENKATNQEESEKRMKQLQEEFEKKKQQDIERLKMQFEKDRLAEIAKVEQKAQQERERHERELQERMQELEKTEMLLQNELMEKKKLHNEMEELKGSIRVCARVRPLSKKETDRGCVNTIEILGEKNLKMTYKRSDKGGEKTDTKNWAFDKVLGPSKGQEAVFEDTERLVQSAIDGYNVCIFAYGQTGAGKTHTMSGPEHDPGILPRALDTLYKGMEAGSKHFKYSVELYMLELHLDSLVDLLSDKPHSSYTSSKSSFQIKKDQFGVVYVENATVIPVESKEELQKFITKGEAKRSTQSTNMNEASSRSHLLISVVIKSENIKSQEITSGKLTLVDLAGSERVAKSGAEGQTFDEAKSINKALSALGEVINALTTKSKHVPYRNNPLTQLMQDSLGGNAKTLMIVNISPADYNCAESIASLNFASRCKAVKNAASKGFETKEIAMLRREIAKLRRQNSGV